MLVLKFIIDFIKILNEKASPAAIAGGTALGAILGITPLGSLHNVVVLFLLFILPVNKSASVLSAALFALVAPLGDPLYNALGTWFLVDFKKLFPLWERLNNTPVFPWTRFNNTLTLGSLVFTVGLFPFLFVLTKRGVVRYRESVLTWLRSTRLIHAIKGSKLVNWYAKFS